MSSLKDKKFIVAISGSIAAYKTAFLVRNLIKLGAEVQVLMTPSSTAFISPLSLSTLSKNKVYTQIIDSDSWNNHVELGLWADAMIVAPATATTLAKMANGIADNIVTAVYLSAKCPCFFAPAMDLDMWKHPSSKGNVSKLQSYGNIYLDVGSGELASGLVGAGRMMEPEDIISRLEEFYSKKKDLINKRILVTAGPTIEKIDPVRFIGNHSSGKMGIAIAEECARRGARVDLILGPSEFPVEGQNITIIRITSAQEMFDACARVHGENDICIFAAAVADYTPADPKDYKIKKKEGDLSLELKRTIDIAATLGEQKKEGQIHVGFALESNNEVENAKKKIHKKNFDIIVLNSLQDKGAGFKYNTNKITILDKHNKNLSFKLKTKDEVAIDIIDTVIDFINENK